MRFVVILRAKLLELFVEHWWPSFKWTNYFQSLLIEKCSFHNEVQMPQPELIISFFFSFFSLWDLLVMASSLIICGKSLSFNIFFFTSNSNIHIWLCYINPLNEINYSRSLLSWIFSYVLTLMLCLTIGFCDRWIKWWNMYEHSIILHMLGHCLTTTMQQAICLSWWTNC